MLCCIVLYFTILYYKPATLHNTTLHYIILYCTIQQDFLISVCFVNATVAIVVTCLHMLFPGIKLNRLMVCIHSSLRVCGCMLVCTGQSERGNVAKDCSGIFNVCY